ncbi:hypothetical protein TNIN_190571 [Trichonephila inaurata madagascariensis]|uniref:Uncharacterized protein n=1 Tax=Trichonephila inaurata madagascariensis TaxID=2747483 RepID=A0A8X6XMB2_9ARAC|nr:hypothetical protein TNIN_190571 [Trichonephila inaurata madagascariensis]
MGVSRRPFHLLCFSDSLSIGVRMNRKHILPAIAFLRAFVYAIFTQALSKRLRPCLWGQSMWDLHFIWTCLSVSYFNARDDFLLLFSASSSPTDGYDPIYQY